MTYQAERDKFIVYFTQRLHEADADSNGYTVAELARKLLRHASTLHRLAEAQCSGDWPAEGPDMKNVVYCSRCMSGWHASAMHKTQRPATDALSVVKRARAERAYALALETDANSCEGKLWAESKLSAPLCPDCRTQDAVLALCAQLPLTPVFSGDPRGAVLRLVPRGTSLADIDSGRERGLYVPSR